MYKVYLGDVLLPVTPSKITTKINNQNKTITLINGQEINLVKSPGLTDISFQMLLPGSRYPFAYYEGFYRSPNWYLDRLKELKLGQFYTTFSVSRLTKGIEWFKTEMDVTVEDYSITEDAKNGFDLVVDIKLKQYVNYGVKYVPLDNVDDGVVKKKTRASSKTIPKTYTVKKGDTLWAIAKKLLGDGAKCWNLAKLNNISNPNIIKVGQVLKIQDVPATTQKSNTASKTSNTKTVATASTNALRSNNGNTTVKKSTAAPLSGLGALKASLTGSEGQGNYDLREDWLRGGFNVSSKLNNKRKISLSDLKRRARMEH